MHTSSLLIALLTLVLAACAPKHHGSAQANLPSAAARAGVLGGWDAGATSYFNRDQETLHISDGAVSVTKVCKSWGRSTSVTVTAPARVSGSHLEVLTPARAVNGPGEVDCEAKIDAGLMAYEIKDNALVFTPALGQTYVYGHRHVNRASGWGASSYRPSSSYTSAARPRLSRAQIQVAGDIGRLFTSWAPSSGSGTTYRATSRPSTSTVSNSYGTGVVRNSGRARVARVR